MESDDVVDSLSVGMVSSTIKELSMSDHEENDPSEESPSGPEERPDPEDEGPVEPSAEAGGGGPTEFQRVRHQPVGARVPDHVRGVFSTGAIVITGQHEAVLDFVTRMARPHRIAARVVMPHAVLGQFIQALRDNLQKYSDRFGPPPELPTPPKPERKPSIEEVYNDLKLPDELLSGTYANGVMIGHSAAEFSIDFFTGFYPQSAVSARVYLSAPQIPRLIKSLDDSYQRLRRPPQNPPGGSPYYPGPDDSDKS